MANEIEPLGVEKDVFLRVEHDAAGNITYIPDTSSTCGDAGRRLTYDFHNRLIEVYNTTDITAGEPVWQRTVSYSYDALNRRVEKNDLDTGTDVVYIYDGLAGHSLGDGSWQCIEEREDDGGTWEARRQYVYGGRYIDEPLIFDKDYDSDGICTDFNYGGSRGAHRYYYAQQVNFNVTAMVVDDGDGSVTFIEWAEYDPYGAATVTIADGQSATGNPYLFQGRRLDTETGLYYFRNRYYSPELGRFLQRDPMGYVDGMGLYEFGRSSPAAVTDALGRDLVGSVGTLEKIADTIEKFNDMRKTAENVVNTAKDVGQVGLGLHDIASGEYEDAEAALETVKLATDVAELIVPMPGDYLSEGAKAAADAGKAIVSKKIACDECQRLRDKSVLHVLYDDECKEIGKYWDLLDGTRCQSKGDALSVLLKSEFTYKRCH